MPFKRSCFAAGAAFLVFASDIRAEETEKHGPLTAISVADVGALSLPVLKVGSGTLEIQVALSGKADLVPARSQHLHPRYQGVVREVLRSVGDRVTTGTILARVENSAGLNSSEIVAGVSGVVLDRGIAPGQAVDEGTQAFVIGDTSQLQARLIAYPRDLERLLPGQRALVRSLSDKREVVSKVSYVAPVLDPKSRTAVVLADLPNEDQQWKPGQFVTSYVTVGTAAVPVLLPTGVAVRVGNKDEARLLVRAGEEFALRVVRLGRSDQRQDEVLSGVVAGDDVIGLPPEEVEDRLEANAAEAHAHDP